MRSSCRSTPSGWSSCCRRRVAGRLVCSRGRPQEYQHGALVSARALHRPAGSWEWLRQYGNRAEGVITTTDFEGRRSLQAFHWSKVTGWRIAAWAPAIRGGGAAAGGLDAPSCTPARCCWGFPCCWRSASAGACRRPSSDLMSAGARSARAGRCSRCPPRCARPTSCRRCSPAPPRSCGPHQAQAHLAAIVSSSPNAMLSLSPDGIIRTWNAAAEQLFGYQASEVIGKSATPVLRRRATCPSSPDQRRRPLRPCGAPRRAAPAQGRPSARRVRQRGADVRRSRPRSSASPRSCATSASARRARSTSSS